MTPSGSISPAHSGNNSTPPAPHRHPGRTPPAHTGAHWHPTVTHRHPDRTPPAHTGTPCTGRTYLTIFQLVMDASSWNWWLGGVAFVGHFLPPIPTDGWEKGLSLFNIFLYDNYLMQFVYYREWYNSPNQRYNKYKSKLNIINLSDILS